VTHAIARLDGSLAYGLRDVTVPEGSGVVVEGTGLILFAGSMVKERVRVTAKVWQKRARVQEASSCVPNDAVLWRE
jgi:hypothetical protein